MELALVAGVHLSPTKVILFGNLWLKYRKENGFGVILCSGPNALRNLHPRHGTPDPWQPARNKRKQELKYNDDLGFHVELGER